MRFRIVLAFVLVAMASIQPAHANPIHSVEGPVFDSLAQAYRYRVEHPDQPLVPQGVNDPHCRATPQRPQAVVLVHGTDTTLFADFSKLGAEIVRAGWCVYGVDYGAGPTADKGYGWASISESVVQLDAAIAAAQAQSGAQQVVLVGFSQGASVARAWMHSDAQHAAATSKWIGLASPTRGGSFYGLAQLARVFPWLQDLVGQVGFVSPALRELTAGSEFMRQLNTPAETVPGPEYVSIATRFDEMMPEGHNTAIHGERARTVFLQDVCPRNLGGHMFMPYNPDVISLVLGELGEARPVQCVPVALGYSIADVVLFDAPRKLSGAATRPAPARLTLTEIPSM